MARVWKPGAILALTAASVAPAAAQRAVVYRVPVTGVIELGLAPYIRRSLQQAEATGAAAVILDVNTLGGRVDAALQIVDAIAATEIPVYAFVDPRAISAGALISVSTDSVFMSPQALMGASTVVTGEGQKASEKGQSVMRAQFRAIAERRGIDPRIGEAMVDEEIEIDGVIEGGKLLTLTTDEAVRVGYALEATSLDDVLEQVGLGGADVMTTSINWAERLVRFLSHPVVAPILLSLGMLGVIVELKTPSFGLAGGLGLLSLAAFFGSHLIIGLAGWEELMLLAAGLVLLGIEIFLIPGFGVAGLLGIACIGAAIFLSLVSHLSTWTDFVRASAILSSAVLIVTVAIFSLVRHLPSSARWKGIFLQAATTRYTSGDERSDLIGAVGVALTDLRPSGTARFGEERLDVVSEAGFVAKGVRVRVVRSDSYRLVVWPEDDGAVA